jgi:hypothetical protein
VHDGHIACQYKLTGVVVFYPYVLCVWVPYVVLREAGGCIIIAEKVCGPSREEVVTDARLFASFHVPSPLSLDMIRWLVMDHPMHNNNSKPSRDRE